MVLNRFQLRGSAARVGLHQRATRWLWLLTLILVGCSSPAPPPAPTVAPAKPTAAAAQPTANPTPPVFTPGAAPQQAAASCSGQMRKLTLGIAVTPPNVVLTTPFVARGLGLFAKHCIDANLVQFEGGLSQTSLTAVAQGAAM